jgi:cytochrome c oxidase cbb3-type subunit IV
MIENVMHHIGGVGVFGVISICIFFAFFAGMLLWAVCLKKNYLSSMQSLPLEDGAAETNADTPVRAKSQCCGNKCKCADKAVRGPKLN